MASALFSFCTRRDATSIVITPRVRASSEFSLLAWITCRRERSTLRRSTMETSIPSRLTTTTTTTTTAATTVKPPAVSTSSCIPPTRSTRRPRPRRTTCLLLNREANWMRTAGALLNVNSDHQRFLIRPWTQNRSEIVWRTSRCFYVAFLYVFWCFARSWKRDSRDFLSSLLRLSKFWFYFILISLVGFNARVSILTRQMHQSKNRVWTSFPLVSSTS